MKFENKTWAPLWLEYSGLPQLLCEKIKGGAAWPLFRKIVELDCVTNNEPDTVEITVAELSQRTGIAPGAIRKSALSMRKLKVLTCFLPEDDDEDALFRVRVPLKTPKSKRDLQIALPRIFAEPPQHFRYIDEIDSEPDIDEASDPILQEVIDLYFSTVGLRMNAFILDELKLLRRRFPIERIRRAFRRAQQNDIHTLNWVVRELIRRKKKSADEEEEPEDIR